jgi:hypothetical protein
MVSIVAAASAIDGFARVVRDAGAEPTLSPTAKDPSRATYIWGTLRANFKMAKPTQTCPASSRSCGSFGAASTAA